MEAVVKNYMTDQPHSIRPGETLAHARDMMAKYKIRHLPVLEQKKVVGLLTERDFALLELYPDTNIKTSTVEDLMIQAVSTCRPEALLSEVAKSMAENKHGCMIVVDKDEELLGIFTAIDALKLVGKIYAD